MICNELINGNAKSLTAISELVYIITPPEDQKTPEHRRLVQRVVDAASVRFLKNESNSIRDALLHFLSDFNYGADLNNANCSALEEILKSAFADAMNRDDFYSVDPFLVATISPDAEGFVEQLKAELQKRVEGFEPRSYRVDCSVILLARAAAALPSEKSRLEVLPSVLKAWQPMGIHVGTTSDVFDYFAKFPAECVPYLPRFKGYRSMRSPQEGSDVGQALDTLIQTVENYIDENPSDDSDLQPDPTQ